MGRMKELAMDYDEAFDVLVSLRDFLDRDITATEELKRESSTLLDEIENRLEECRLISNTSAPTIILGLLKKKSNSLYLSGKEMEMSISVGSRRLRN